MKKHSFPFYLLILFPSLSFSQTLSGRIMEQDGQTPIPFVNIWYKNKTVGTFSNNEGFFEIPSGSYDTIVFSCIGYERKELVLRSNRLDLNVLLKSDPVVLQEVIVDLNNRWESGILGASKGAGKSSYLGLYFEEFKKQFWKVEVPNVESVTGLIRKVKLDVIKAWPEQGSLVVGVNLTSGRSDERALLAREEIFHLNL
ncbi:MAG: carboxypeptidase-like regulatory domain-containing protein [Cyclobacteriaceae bacterium]